MPTSQVVQVQGTTLRVSVAPVTDAAVTPLPLMAELDCMSREIQYQSGTAAEIDVTTFCSTAKEFRLGLDDPGQFTFNGHWVQSAAAHKVIRAAANDKLSRLFVVVFADGSEFRALGFVSQRSFSAAVDGVVTGSFTVRLTGAVVEIDADENIEPELDTRPRYFVAPANAHSSGTQGYLDAATPVPGSTVGGRSGTFQLQTSGSTNYGWLAVLASVTANGLIFTDATGTPGDWNGAGLPGANTDASPTPAESTVLFEDQFGHSWRLFRQDYPNANPVASAWTIS